MNPTKHRARVFRVNDRARPWRALCLTCGTYSRHGSFRPAVLTADAHTHPSTWGIPAGAA